MSTNGKVDTQIPSLKKKRKFRCILRRKLGKKWVSLVNEGATEGLSLTETKAKIDKKTNRGDIRNTPAVNSSDVGSFSLKQIKKLDFRQSEMKGMLEIYRKLGYMLIKFHLLNEATLESGHHN